MDGFIIDLPKRDTVRWHALELAEQLKIQTACIETGFIRNLVWDDEHDLRSDCPNGDVDVLWFDAEGLSHHVDLEIPRQTNQKMIVFF